MYFFSSCTLASFILKVTCFFFGKFAFILNALIDAQIFSANKIFVGCDLGELLKTAETLKIERAAELLLEMLEDKDTGDDQNTEEDVTMCVYYV